MEHTAGVVTQNYKIKLDIVVMQWMRFCKHFYDPDIKAKTGI